MFVESVVGELKALLGTVRPQIPVHTAVNRLAVFIYAGAPSIVPHAAPVLLLFEADDVGDIGSLVPGGLEGAKKGETGRAGTDDGYTFLLGHLHFGLMDGSPFQNDAVAVDRRGRTHELMCIFQYPTEVFRISLDKYE